MDEARPAAEGQLVTQPGIASVTRAWGQWLIIIGTLSLIGCVAPSRAHFVDRASGIAFDVPVGLRLVRPAPPVGIESSDDDPFSIFQLVSDESAVVFGKSGSRAESASPHVVASIFLDTCDRLCRMVSVVPGEYRHDLRIGEYPVTVLEQTPIMFGDRTRTYVLVLPHGFGIAVCCMNDKPESSDTVAHALLASVRT